jgi:hypothetical protein
MKPTQQITVREEEDRLMRQKLWFFAGLILIWTGIGQAKGLEIITPPLLGVGTACLVTNVSDAPVDVVIEVLDHTGQREYGRSVEAVPPLSTFDTPRSVGAPLPDYMARTCRVTSDAAKKGDLKVTFCILPLEDPVCHAAVTAE